MDRFEELKKEIQATMKLTADNRKKVDEIIKLVLNNG